MPPHQVEFEGAANSNSTWWNISVILYVT